MLLLCMYSVALRGNVVVGFYNIYIFYFTGGAFTFHSKTKTEHDSK